MDGIERAPQDADLSLETLESFSAGLVLNDYELVDALPLPTIGGSTLEGAAVNLRGDEAYLVIDGGFRVDRGDARACGPVARSSRRRGGGCGYLSKQEGTNGSTVNTASTVPLSPMHPTVSTTSWMPTETDTAASGRGVLCPERRVSVTVDGDRDDSNPDIHPGAVEVCDEFD